MLVIDKKSHVPIYVQIEEELKKKIFHGEYKEGEAIPSERYLTEMFDVSRMTVRQAITNLVTSGLLYREKGRGTFVSTPKFEQSLNSLTSFTEDMISRGLTPSSKIIKFEKQVPSVNIAEDLSLEVGEEVYFIMRIRNADEKPMAIERTYIPVKLFPNLQEEKLDGSLYRLVEKNYGLKIGHAIQQMEASHVNTEDRKYLQLEENAVVLIMKRMSYLSNNQPFELVQSAYRADRYKFYNRIQR